MNPSRDQSPERRRFLQFISGQTLALGFGPSLLQSLGGCAHKPPVPASALASASASAPASPSAPAPGFTFQGLKPSHSDELRLAPGLNHKMITMAGQRINQKGEVFGDYNDFTSFIPFKGTTGEGILWVNHESVTPEFLHSKTTAQLTHSKEEILKEQKMVGGSLLHLKKQKGIWELQKDSPYNRRLDGTTPIPFSHGYKIQGSSQAIGTLANCAGGQTPWKTILTSEENYDAFYGEAFLKKGKRSVKTLNKLNWWKQFPRPPEHYGWIVEVDPMTGRAEKQILLGRAPHEGATVTMAKEGQAVVYMGEDRDGGFIYKFVSTGAHFKKGTLYAANTLKGSWLPLDLEQSPILKKHFKRQLDVLTYAHQSADLVGATPQNRPEDVEIHPQTGEVFVALTHTKKKKNDYGSLLKISEGQGPQGTRFTSSTWISGGPEKALACPDNLCFDPKGNLWVTTDIPQKLTHHPKYRMFGNNGLYYIPTSGPEAGLPRLVATAPVDAEFTGPWFAPDKETLFLSVQHPGVRKKRGVGLMPPTSHWPEGKGQTPRSAVISIQGSLLKQLISV